jgi:ferredoxin-thioredoxin reductase catalytic subunit
MVASRQGWRLNPDTEFIEFLFEGLAKNSRRYGYYSCPCRDAHGERARDSDIICPCAYCRPDQEEYGHCYCGLFLTEKFAQGGGQPVSIPERRPGE